MSVIDELIDDDFVDEIVEEVGMGAGAWDMVDPKQICLEAIKLYLKKIEELEARWKQNETTS